LKRRRGQDGNAEGTGSEVDHAIEDSQTDEEPELLELNNQRVSENSEAFNILLDGYAV